MGIGDAHSGPALLEADEQAYEGTRRSRGAKRTVNETDEKEEADTGGEGHSGRSLVAPIEKNT